MQRTIEKQNHDVVETLFGAFVEGFQTAFRIRYN